MSLVMHTASKNSFTDMSWVIVMQADGRGIRQCYNMCTCDCAWLQEFHVDGLFYC